MHVATLIMRHTAALFLPLLLFLSGTVAGPAKAQELLNVPSAEKSIPPQSADEAEPGTDKTALALRYFNLCDKTQLMEQDAGTRASFCSCSADRALRGMSTAQLAALAQGKIARADEVMFISKIQSPCLSYPLLDIEYRKCLARDSNAFKTRTSHEDMCHCLSGAMARFTNEYGADLMAAEMALGGIPDNPLQALRQSSSYGQEYGSRRMACLDQYAFR